MVLNFCNLNTLNMNYKLSSSRKPFEKLIINSPRNCLIMNIAILQHTNIIIYSLETVTLKLRIDVKHFK